MTPPTLPEPQATQLSNDMGLITARLTNPRKNDREVVEAWCRLCDALGGADVRHNFAAALGVPVDSIEADWEPST